MIFYVYSENGGVMNYFELKALIMIVTNLDMITSVG